MERGWPGGPGKRGRFLWWEIEERRGKENASVCMLSPSLLRLETSTVAYQDSVKDSKPPLIIMMVYCDPRL